eukprot:TRINITY_DN33755_c0_g1_i1.p1 TRINITY_DN33755_c0_g1~~TRINITY_DN33755_c0_g1_i1.p1  ORF type:complete len:488 (+),score=157.17 TRINITY_DN33755_c0_g1_i1:82-1545(+)
MAVVVSNADLEKADDAAAVEEAACEDGTADGDAAAASAGDASADGELPELMDLIDAVEEAGEDVERLTAVIRDIGKRIRLTPDDRDFLTDFEGVANICKALSAPPHEWRGPAMLAFCRIMPEVCRTSTVNRGSLRDEGFVAAAVELLRTSIADGDEQQAAAAAMALAALCTGNDGNKKAAAQVPASAADEEASANEKPGALLLLLEALGRFEDSLPVQTEAISALRALVTDDDPRKADCEPAALQNREIVSSDAGFPFTGTAIDRAFSLLEKAEKPQVKLQEQALLLLREVSRRKELLPTLAMDAKFLTRVQPSLQSEEVRVVRGALAVLRGFAQLEDVRDELALLSDGAEKCRKAVRKHIGTAAICEQGFGLLANMTMRKSPVTGKMNEGEAPVITLASEAILQHRDRPDVMRSIVHTVRNMAVQEELAATEVKMSTNIIPEVRMLVQAHEGQAKWHAAVDISRQFLREHRADEGMLKQAQYNAYY